MSCSNFECDGNTWGDKIRCSKCRHSKLYTCTSCGYELSINRAIRCKDCSRFNKNSSILTYQSIPENKVKMGIRRRAKYREDKLAKNV